MSPCSGHVPLPFNTCLVSLKYAISELKGRHTPTMQKSKGLQVHQAIQVLIVLVLGEDHLVLSLHQLEHG